MKRNHGFLTSFKLFLFYFNILFHYNSTFIKLLTKLFGILFCKQNIIVSVPKQRLFIQSHRENIETQSLENNNNTIIVLL